MHIPLGPGARLGPYTLSQPLGRGASATVFLARSTEREVAIKVRARGDVELDRRFLREFEAMRGLSMPGVVRVFDAGMDDAWLWYAMEVVHGLPLRSWIEGAESLPARVQRLLQVAPLLCDTLAAVHRAGILHRDLKPSNVLVSADGQPHVLDFGVARGWAEDAPLTAVGGLVGTLPFMSPEQAGGQPLTGRSDLFAVGLMLYEGVGGKRPRALRPQDWLWIQCLDRPRPLAARFPWVPIDVSAVVDRLLAFDPRDRPDAEAAAALFRACVTGTGPKDWPESHAHVGSVSALERADALLRGEGPRLFVLSGPGGSGRRRAVEHIRRRALLSGMRTVRARCRVERPGGAVEELLETLLEAPADPAWRQRVAGEDCGTLLEMWPHLPLAPPSGPGFAASAEDVVEAASTALIRAVGDGLLLVLECAEEIDRFSARVLDRLARAAPPTLAIICTLDDRLAPRRAHRTLHELAHLRLATLHTLPDLDATAATAVATALVPDGHPVSARPGSPLAATEAGWAALAALRGEVPPRLPATAFPAALETRALHAAAWRALGVDPDILVAQGVLTREGPARMRIHSESARASALARLGKRETEARRLAAAWEADPGPERHAGQARALLLAEDTEAALCPAVRAAIEAERQGRYREARDWLVLVDALPRDQADPSYRALKFSLAACRASVAFAIGSERARADLVTLVHSRAQNDAQRAEARLLTAELTYRQGDPRAALVAYLKLASRLGSTSPALAVRALTRSGEVRLQLGAPVEALAEVERAEALRGGWRGDTEQVRLDLVRVDAGIATGTPAEALSTCTRALHLATGLGFAPGVASHSLRLGLTSYFLGYRAQAEVAVERARRVRVETGERGAAAGAAAWLGWLMVGRGDAAAAHLLGDEALTVSRRLKLRGLRGLSLALAVQIATVRGDDATAIAALEEAAQLGLVNGTLVEGTPVEGPLAVAAVRWWRTHGEPARALEVPIPKGGFFGVEAALERARTLIERGDRVPAQRLLDAAETAAHAAGYRELLLYARVVRAAITGSPDTEWASLVVESSASTWVDLYLWILERDASRRARIGDYSGARRRLLELAARAQEHGHRPYERLAQEQLEG